LLKEFSWGLCRKLHYKQASFCVIMWTYVLICKLGTANICEFQRLLIAACSVNETDQSGLVVEDTKNLRPLKLGSWVWIPLEAWMSVCFYSVLVLSCVGSGLVTGWSPVQGVLPIVCKIHNFRINSEWEKYKEPNPLRRNNNNNNCVWSIRLCSFKKENVLNCL
jgi:hypothetical protein